MDFEFLKNSFILFGGLFGYYALYRLHPMRLYDWQIGIGYKTQSDKKSKIYRFLLGCMANAIVASSFAISWFWFKFLIADNFKAEQLSILAQISAISIVISSSSLLLLTHRIVAFVAIWKKQILFLDDVNFPIENDQQFKIFLNSDNKWSHIKGAFLFFLAQISFGLFAKLVLVLSLKFA